MFQKEIIKTEILNLPVFVFKGAIHIITNKKETERAVQIIEKEHIIGFDTETKPSFLKNTPQNFPALLQISLVNEVFLFRLQKKEVFTSLVDILENTEILKVGVAIQDDMNNLKKITKFTPQNILDLNKVAKELGFQNIGIRNLAALILHVRISKAQRTSNWENEPLTQSQIQYAATDAWVCQKIYHLLKQEYSLKYES
ncbi:MAG: 3'-5' exonuclease [Chitinophagaceae bacterium]|nr:3'-5' exonuclease [Chitinophagaceae bacterium]